MKRETRRVEEAVKSSLFMLLCYLSFENKFKFKFKFLGGLLVVLLVRDISCRINIRSILLFL